jgi:tRNA A37 threonylcarbamoyladenosine dehydratase
MRPKSETLIETQSDICVTNINREKHQLFSNYPHQKRSVGDIQFLNSSHSMCFRQAQI